MKKKDLLVVGLLFGLIVDVGVNIYSSNRIYKLQKEVLDTKMETINFYNEAKEYIKVLEDSRESLNNALDDKERHINQLEKNNELLKELSLIDGDIKYLTVAVCKTESDLNKKAKHKRKSIIGKICGVDKLWLEEIPELNKGNINTLYGGSLVIKHLMTKYKSKREVIKRYKGIESKSNMYLIDRVIKIEHQLK